MDSGRKGRKRAVGSCAAAMAVGGVAELSGRAAHGRWARLRRSNREGGDATWWGSEICQAGILNNPTQPHRLQPQPDRCVKQPYAASMFPNTQKLAWQNSHTRNTVPPAHQTRHAKQPYSGTRSLNSANQACQAPQFSRKIPQLSQTRQELLAPFQGLGFNLQV